MAFVKVVVPLVGWVIDVTKVSLKSTIDCKYPNLYYFVRIFKTEKKYHLKNDGNSLGVDMFVRLIISFMLFRRQNLLILEYVIEGMCLKLSFIESHEIFSDILNGSFEITFNNNFLLGCI